MITFDDGGASALHAGEELARRSWRGHFFIATDLVGRPGYLDWDGVRAVAGMGHVIGSHSCSHPDRMAACSWDQLMDEWSGSAAMLAQELGHPVPTASVPGGLYSRSVGRAAAAAGFTSLFTSLPSQRLRSIDGCRADRPLRDPQRHRPPPRRPRPRRAVGSRGRASAPRGGCAARSRRSPGGATRACAGRCWRGASTGTSAAARRGAGPRRAAGAALPGCEPATSRPSPGSRSWSNRW